MVRCGAVALRYYASQFNAGTVVRGETFQTWSLPASELAELLIQAGMVRCGAVALRYYASQFNAGTVVRGETFQTWSLPASELAELLIQAGMVRCGAVALRYYASQFNAGAVVGGETGQALRMSGSRQRKQCTQVNDKSKNFDLHVVSALEHSKNQFRAIISLKCPCPSR